MIFKTNFLQQYVGLAPLPLAIERSLECEILSRQSFDGPVLDIGCGEGLFASILFAQQIETGIDPNERELERARALGGYRKLIACRGDSIPEPDQSYGTVFSNSVMEHIPSINSVLDEAFRLLRSGGRMFLTVPSNRFDEYSVVSQLLLTLGLEALQKRYLVFYNRFWVHYHYAAPAEWAEIVRARGFEIVEAYSYAPKRVCTFNDLLVPFSLPGFVMKRVTNRWTLFPALRRIILAPLTSLARSLMRGGERCNDGGLVFIAARKP